jgi:hypothetical protein
MIVSTNLLWIFITSYSFLKEVTGKWFKIRCPFHCIPIPVKLATKTFEKLLTPLKTRDLMHTKFGKDFEAHKHLHKRLNDNTSSKT